MTTHPKFDPIEIAHLKMRTRISSVFGRLNIKIRGGFCLCPFHMERTPSCKVDDRRGTWVCFGCGQWGDHIDLLMLRQGMSFTEAVEALGGARKLTPKEADDAAGYLAEIEREEAEARRKSREKVARLWGKTIEIAGTHGQAYLESRHLTFDPSLTRDIRFMPALSYWGFGKGSDEIVELGHFPAMVAAIRQSGPDGPGALIGLHRTYLDPDRPAKLTPPGDPERNKTKKVMGEQMGGVIFLTEPRCRMAMGEGIETVWAWRDLSGEDCGLATGVSLGNMCGRCTGSMAHPEKPGRRIPNGMPDMDQPGIVLPDEVEEIILLGDGDSDRAMTRARLLAGLRRFAHQGKLGFISMADDGFDWASVLKSEKEKVTHARLG